MKKTCINCNNQNCYIVGLLEKDKKKTVKNIMKIMIGI